MLWAKQSRQLLGQEKIKANQSHFCEAHWNGQSMRNFMDNAWSHVIFIQSALKVPACCLGQEMWSTSYKYNSFHSFNSPITSLYLQKSKTRQLEVKWLAQPHKDGNGQSKKQNPGVRQSPDFNNMLCLKTMRNICQIWMTLIADTTINIFLSSWEGKKCFSKVLYSEEWRRQAWIGKKAAADQQLICGTLKV